MKLAKFIISALFLFSLHVLNAQSIELNYLSPKEYEVGGIEIEGADHLDKNSVILLAGISVGEKVFLPSDKTSIAIDKLWKQGVFEDIQISVSRIEGKTIFLTYHLKTKPRLSGYKIEGVKRAEADKISETMKIYAGDVVTENLKSNCKNIIAEHFIDKGFFSINTEIEEIKDTNFNRNEVFLKFKINKGEKIRIGQINVKGNNIIAEKKIRSKMKDTKIYRWWRIWKSSRFVDEDFQTDKELVINEYNNQGFRDARIIRDSVYIIDSYKTTFWGKKKPIKEVAIDLEVYEGPKFFFRDITWVGNTKYSSEDLSKRLRIQKGDPYNKGLLEKNLNYDPTGTDIYSLYTDDGYLFFRVMPTEIKVENDSIDIEMRVYEGKQARVGKVTLSGNTITNDYVVMRELKTYPGDLFSRDAVYRSLREIQQLGYFDPEKIVPDIRPNQESGTVDIEYQLVEKSSSQFDLSGGIGGGYVIFQAGISLTNFSTQKFLVTDSRKSFKSILSIV
jgi:outer membrane protein insertion porin family